MNRFLFLLTFICPLVFASPDEDALKTILLDVKRGWEQADGTPFRAHFLEVDDSRYFESGGQNVGLDDLIDHHVVPEGKSIKLDLNFDNLQINIHEDFAWVLADMEVKGTFIDSDRTIHNRGHQTVVFRNIDGKWKVLHTHSSSRSAKSKSNH